MSEQKMWQISAQSCDELRYRFFLVSDSLQLWYYLGLGLKETYESFLDETPEYRLRAVTVAYALLQLVSILDGEGKYSLPIYKYEAGYRVNKGRLRQMFPILNEKIISELSEELTSALNKHSKTIRKILDMRHQKIAHMGAKIGYWRNDGKYSNYSHKSIVPKSFPKVRIQEVATALNTVLEKAYSAVEFYRFKDIGPRVRKPRKRKPLSGN